MSHASFSIPVSASALAVASRSSEPGDSRLRAIASGLVFLAGRIPVCGAIAIFALLVSLTGIILFGIQHLAAHAVGMHAHAASLSAPAGAGRPASGAYRD